MSRVGLLVLTFVSPRAEESFLIEMSCRVKSLGIDSELFFGSYFDSIDFTFLSYESEISFPGPGVQALWAIL